MFDLNQPTLWSLLPSATKLRRLCFYRRVSVHGGGDICLSACSDTRSKPPPPRADTPRADTPPEQTAPQSRNPPRANPPQSRHPQSRYPPQSRQPPQSRNPPQSRHSPRSRQPHRSRHPSPRDSHCCGRYASYWNAFLFNTTCSHHL